MRRTLWQGPRPTQHWFEFPEPKPELDRQPERARENDAAKKQRNRTLIAFHESAHGVCHYHLGGTIKRLFIDDLGYKHLMHGGCVVDRDNDVTDFNRIVSALVGEASNLHFFGVD